MSSQISLLDITSALSAAKKREKLESLTNLKIVLNQEKVIKSLNKNSEEQNKNINWDILLIKVHNAVLSLIDENVSKKGQLFEKHQQIIQSAIIIVVEKSAQQKLTLISSDLLVTCTLAVFETELRSKSLGSTYINLLQKYVLSQGRKWSDIKEENWIGMKDLCISQFKKFDKGTHSILFLEILTDIVRHSSKFFQISHNFLDIFDFVKEIYILYKNNGSNFGIALLHLTNTLCLQLAVEFRFKVCEFMESVFDVVINLYEKKSAEKNTLVYHFLLITLNVHNPNGIWQDKCSYACNLEKWTSQIREIIFLCHQELKFLLKNPERSDVEEEFLDLFVYVSHLVVLNSWENFPKIIDCNVSFDDPESSNKRKCSVSLPHLGKVKQIKLDSSFQNLLKDIQTPDSWFWLRFLERLLLKYPYDLKKEYSQFVEVLYQLICDKREIEITKLLLRCLCSLLEMESSLLQELTAEQTKVLTVLWNKINVELLRLFQTGPLLETHLLFRALIRHSKLSNPEPIVKLYCNHQLSPNLESFESLCILFQNCILPELLPNEDNIENEQENCFNIRTRLLLWLFQGEIKYPCKDLAKLLITLILKKFENEITNNTVKEDILISKIGIHDFLKLITNNYMTVGLKNINFISNSKTVNCDRKIRIDSNLNKKLMELMAFRGKHLLDSLNNTMFSNLEDLNSVKDCLWFCELLCHLLSQFECMSDVSKETNFLYEVLESLLYACTTKSSEIMKKKLFDLTPFYNLYDTNFHNNVKKKIREPQFFNSDFYKLILELFEDRTAEEFKDDILAETDNILSVSRFSQLIKNPQSVLHFQNLATKEKLLINALEFLCQFSVSPVVSNYNSYQNTLLAMINKFVANEPLNVNSSFHLQFILRSAYSLVNHEGSCISALNFSLDLLLLIYDIKCTDCEVLIMILQILKNSTWLIYKMHNEESFSKYMRMLDGYKTIILIKKKCGNKVASKFIECIAEISKAVLEKNDFTVEKRTLSLKLIESILCFLQDAYLEIRLTAAQYVGLMFINTKKLDESVLLWQEIMLEKLFEVFNSISQINDEKKEFVVEYFNLVFTSVSLISWANIIFLSNYWRKKALFCMLRLAYLKTFRNDQVEGIIKVICNELKISFEKYILSNLSFLIHNWIQKELRIQKFPFYLFGFATFEEFVEKNYPMLVTFSLRSGRTDMLNMISLRLKKPIDEIIKGSFPVLVSFVLPAMSENVDSEIAKNAQKMKCLIDQKLSTKSWVQPLTESIDEVIFNMIRNIHDPDYLKTLCEFFGNLDNDLTSISFTTTQVEETLKSLSANEGKGLLGKIALEVPSVIEKIFVYLVGDLEKAIIYEDKVLAFYKYIFFVEMIIKVTNKKLMFRNINAFIIRDVVYTIIGVVRKDEEEMLSTMACICLKKLSDFYLKNFSTIFGQFLPAITTALLPLVKRSNNTALSLLNFLICDNYESLESDIACLDPFPTGEAFVKINILMEKIQRGKKTLKHRIANFIKAGKSINLGCRIEGLRNIRQALSTEKEDLKEMYEDLRKMRGFSEDCKTSLLHQLICMLIQLIREENEVVKIEAANCLAELGPSDLTTFVLRLDNYFTTAIEAASGIYKFFKLSIGILTDLVVSDNYLIKKASSRALYAILSSKQGKEIIYSLSDISMGYLTPFSSLSSSNFEIQIIKDIFKEKLINSEEWMPNNHEKWIVNLLNRLLQSLKDNLGVADSFRELIKVHWQFGEKIFPILLNLILSLNQKDCNEIIYKSINEFFKRNFDYKEKLPIATNTTTAQCMVNVVDCIRIQGNHEGNCQGFDFGINYLHVAKAALHCSAFFTAIFYGELWFEEKKKKEKMNLDINLLCECFPDEGFYLTEILRECYSKIGNFDGIHGCGYMHILDVASEIQHYEHLKNWNLSMLHHDIQLSEGNASSSVGLLKAFEQSGMFYTLRKIIKENHNSPNVDNILYNCAAKLQDWSLINPTFTNKNHFGEDCFNKCYYFALKAFHNEDDATFQHEIYKARKSILNKLMLCSLESSNNLYHLLSELQCLKELQEFSETFRNSSATKIQNLHAKWNKQDSIKCEEFKLIESIFTNRIIMIKNSLLGIKSADVRHSLHLILGETCYKLSKIARKEKKYDTAIRTLNYINSINSVSEKINSKAKLEKSILLWERGDREIGKFLLSHFIKANIITGEYKAKSLRIYGDWMAVTKSENSRDIIENYYLKSIAQSNESKNRIDSFASLAKFADRNYEQLNEYLCSPLFEIKQNLINTQQDLASELRQELGWNQNREKRMAYQIAARQSAIDENEIKNSKRERDSYLNLALKYYLMSLKEGDKYNLVVFRIISLWLSNGNNPEVIQQLQKFLDHIPTYKFLCLLPQLVPRMADVCLITLLIEKILLDHPHHTLPLIFALKNSYEDLKYNGMKKTPTTSRVLAAKSMLEKFNSHPKLSKFIEEMDNFCNALIEIANYNPVNNDRSASLVNFPKHLKIQKINDLTSVIVPSINLPYNKNCVYDNIVGVHKFEQSYYLVGGVNLPKRIKCIGTDGVGRTLLVKGKDDLRQDAVMQQVFTIMNSLLYENSETNKRRLVIRTYKVVPLSQRSGVIEWCENTQPLSLYLIGVDGKSGAHKKFYPEDTTALECRAMIKKVFAQPQVTNNDKLNVFLKICEQIHPVLHYFFIEKFPAAGVWFERRLAYIHSIATSSMIGYILGIGDRHVHNILIDNSTAEVIHIDLGIAFEQGKTLPTPETVPFRLTRDIVDGMGLSGVEGDFRISSVKTMEVLRENQDTILTLLEVLLYDPLYAWTITPEKAYLMQNQTESSSTTTDKSSSEVETNKMAERALIRLKQKLQGTEGGCSPTNVEGQVSYLIQQARDPNNLCRLFHGWQAYL